MRMTWAKGAFVGFLLGAGVAETEAMRRHRPPPRWFPPRPDKQRPQEVDGGPSFSLGPGVRASVSNALTITGPRPGKSSESATPSDWTYFKGAPYFDLKFLHPSLPGSVVPLKSSYSYYAKYPGGLPCDIFVLARPDGRGITLNTVGCALFGPRHGPNLKAGMSGSVRWEGNHITVMRRSFRAGISVAGYYYYVDFGLDGSMTAKVDHMVMADQHPLLFLTFQSPLPRPHVDKLPLGWPLGQ